MFVRVCCVIGTLDFVWHVPRLVAVAVAVVAVAVAVAAAAAVVVVVVVVVVVGCCWLLLVVVWC